MKKIINGLRYDTEAATLIGAAEAGGFRSDFRWWQAELYRTKAGRYFLAGEGGPMTRWAEPCGSGSYTGSSDLFPMTAGEALEWAELHLRPEEVEAAFAAQIEDA